MRKLVYLLFLFLGIAGGVVLGRAILTAEDQTTALSGTTGSTEAPRVDKAVESPKLGKPVLLTVPKLTLNLVAVEHVGLDGEGKMDVPKDDMNVAWFDLGYRPGARGSAVIAGHFDKSTGEPAIFYNLGDLIVGDEISLESDDGSIQIYKVVDKKLYPYDEFPTQFVFGPSKGKMLNLITCGGVWDPTARNYSNRLVVFTELAE